MKSLKIRKDKLTREQKAELICELVKDVELQGGGIASCEEYVKDRFNITTAEFDRIHIRLYKLFKSIK